MGELRRGQYLIDGGRVREFTLRLLVIVGDDMVPIFIHSEGVDISPSPVVVVVKVAAAVGQVRFVAC